MNYIARETVPSGFAIRALDYNVCKNNMTVCSLRSILPVEEPRQVFSPCYYYYFGYNVGVLWPPALGMRTQNAQFSPCYQGHRFYMNSAIALSSFLHLLRIIAAFYLSYSVNKSYKTLYFSCMPNK